MLREFFAKTKACNYYVLFFLNTVDQWFGVLNGVTGIQRYFTISQVKLLKRGSILFHFDH